MARKALSKTVRFEVFKRDRFTCQYCGAKAPEVVLHVDHIHPVAEGGTNEILNLATACAGCNGGKGARLLDDRSAVERQRSQIEELQSRREQLEMMLEWRDTAQAAVVDVVEAVAERMEARSRLYLNETGKSKVRLWLKRFSLAEVLTAMDEAFDRFLVFRDDVATDASFSMAFNKIPVFAGYARRTAEKPFLPKLAYIQGILRNRLDHPQESFMAELEDIHGWGVTLDEMQDEAKRTESFCDFWDAMVVIGKARAAAKPE